MVNSASIRACLALVLCFGQVAGLAAAAPLAPWASATGLETLAGLRFSDLKRARCLPQTADSEIPAYPKASIIGLAWGRQPPDCRLRSGWSELGAIVLATRAGVSEVADWYGKRLDEHTRYDTADGVIFLRGQPTAFNFLRDYYKYPNVYVRKADALWRNAGYTVVIELNRPAP